MIKGGEKCFKIVKYVLGRNILFEVCYGRNIIVIVEWLMVFKIFFKFK